MANLTFPIPTFNKEYPPVVTDRGYKITQRENLRENSMSYRVEDEYGRRVQFDISGEYIYDAGLNAQTLLQAVQEEATRRFAGMEIPKRAYVLPCGGCGKDDFRYADDYLCVACRAGVTSRPQ